MIKGKIQENTMFVIVITISDNFFLGFYVFFENILDGWLKQV